MKSFTQYLTESTKTYEFKIRIAGDCGKDTAKKLKQGLGSFGVASCSAGKRLPIQESPVDFPEHQNVNITIFDVTLSYPTNSVQVRAAVSEALKCGMESVRVRNLKEEAEDDINHEFDKPSGEAMLGADYEASNNQDLVGGKHTMSMLKALNKHKTELEQYKGVNDDLLAKSAPGEKPADQSVKQYNKSPVGSRKVTLPTVGGR